MNGLFPTQEVGSLSKPGWRIKGYRGRPLLIEDVAEAVHWGKRLKIENYDALIKVLNEAPSEQRSKDILEWSATYAIRFFEAAGLNILFDGEQWRSEMYEHVIRNSSGFCFVGFVKSFDYRYFNKAAVVDKPRHDGFFYFDEFLFTRQNTHRAVKIPFTGPYTLVDWTFNEHYEKKLGVKVADLRRRKFEARREFLFDLVEGVVRPEIDRLVNAGASWIQIDEPAVTTNPADEEMQLFVDAFNETVKGFSCAFSLHNCYSNYRVLAEYASKLQNCSQLTLEFANRDSQQLGVGDVRTGYKDLKAFDECEFEGKYGLGVVDVHTDFVESPDLIRDRILHAAKVVGEPDRIVVSTDCGLRTRSWEISFQKLRNMVRGAELARQAFA